MRASAEFRNCGKVTRLKFVGIRPMVVTLVALVTLPNVSTSLQYLIENSVVPITQKQSGFVSQACFSSEYEPRLVTVVAFWNSKSAANAFQEDVIPEILEVLRHLLATEPVITEHRCLSISSNVGLSPKLVSPEKSKIITFPSRGRTRKTAR